MKKMEKMKAKIISRSNPFELGATNNSFLDDVGLLPLPLESTLETTETASPTLHFCHTWQNVFRMSANEELGKRVGAFLVAFDVGANGS